MPNPRVARVLSLVAISALLIVGTWWARSSLGIELELQSMRTFVEGLGPTAPIVFVLLITFRAVLGIPSQLALIAAGLCFGTVSGTLIGALGLTLSGLLTFLLSRYAGREAVERRVPDRFRTLFDSAGRRLGAVLVGVATAYPFGFITGYHALAGVTAMPLGLFAPALIAGSSVRAVTYTFFGNALVEGGPEPILKATGLIAAAILLPLLVPRVRGWLARTVLVREQTPGP